MGIEGSEVSQWAARQAGGASDVPGTMDVGEDVIEDAAEPVAAGIAAQLATHTQALLDLAEMLDQDIHSSDRRLITDDDVADMEDVLQVLRDNAETMKTLCAEVEKRAADLVEEDEADDEDDSEDDEDAEEDEDEE